MALLTFDYENADFIIRARVIAELKNRSTGISDKRVTVTFFDSSDSSRLVSFDFDFAHSW